MEVPVVVVTEGLPGHVQSPQGSVQVVVDFLVDANGPVRVGAEEERIGVPVRNQNVLRADGSTAVHFPQHLVQLLHHLLLGHGADLIIEGPHNGAEEEVSASLEIFPPGLQVLPNLESSSGVGVHVHDVVIVIPERNDAGGELDEDLDVPHHLEHVDNFRLPRRQRRVEADII